MKWKEDPRYAQIIRHVLNSEGGYADHPNDPGGPTMYGIAWNYNQTALKAQGITRETMRSLSLDQAREIYYWKYWQASGADRIPDIRLAYVHFDAAVNHGVGAARSFVSRLTPSPFNYEGGGKNRELFDNLFKQYLNLRERAYRGDPNFKTFGKGWMNRLRHIQENAKKLRD